jgi:uncharacterized protein (DUF488 family)
MNTIMREAVFTIGHSTQPQDQLIALLQEHGIQALGDVRSAPYSRVNPQFNREELTLALGAHGIRYVFLGKELGARSEDPTCYENGKIRYDCLARTGLFRYGLQRIQKGMKKYKLAIMCAERDPIECHRGILIARHLVELGLGVQHILGNGSLEGHSDAMARLTGMLNLSQPHMFYSPEELLADAYRRQEERIAFDSSHSEAAVRGAVG